MININKRVSIKAHIIKIIYKNSSSIFYERND